MGRDFDDVAKMYEKFKTDPNTFIEYKKLQGEKFGGSYDCLPEEFKTFIEHGSNFKMLDWQQSFMAQFPDPERLQFGYEEYVIECVEELQKLSTLEKAEHELMLSSEYGDRYEEPWYQTKTKRIVKQKALRKHYRDVNKDSLPWRNEYYRPLRDDVSDAQSYLSMNKIKLNKKARRNHRGY